VLFKIGLCDRRPFQRQKGDAKFKIHKMGRLGLLIKKTNLISLHVSKV